jgi:hypothetical protein
MVPIVHCLPDVDGEKSGPRTTGASMSGTVKLKKGPWIGAATVLMSLWATNERGEDHRSSFGVCQ